ncbi:trehalose-phosphatase [Chloroflexota bacterium]
MQHLFQSWESFSSDVIVSSHVLLLLDYDGTLTPIVSRPEEAILSSEVREKLHTFNEKPVFSVGIISGRSLPEVRSLVGVEGIYYAGNHGLEIEGPGLKFIQPSAKAAQPKIRNLLRQLSNELANIEGVIIEHKGLSLSVHYRLVRKSQEEIVAQIFHQITSPWLLDGKIKVGSGKKVLEVRPSVDWHKGKAVEIIMEETKITLGGEGNLVIYLGDDTTDEDAFGVIHQPWGWSIFVGQDNPSSKADYFLNSPTEVEKFLARLLRLK